jgi:uncharacterized protein YndB with AHSA1/START domain
MSDTTVSKEDSIVIERVFDAPVALIWQMWTEAEHFKNWYGPQGFSIPVAKMDVRVGGKRLFCMESPDGSMKMWLAGEYIEIVPRSRLVYTESMSDAEGNILENGDHSTITQIIVELEELDGRTKMVMIHAGVPASEQGANEGWKQAIETMAKYAETVRQGK